MGNTGTVNPNGMVTQAEVYDHYSNQADVKTNKNVLYANSMQGTSNAYADKQTVAPKENALDQGAVNHIGSQFKDVLTDLIKKIINLMLNLFQSFGAGENDAQNAVSNSAATAEASADDGPLPPAEDKTSDNVAPNVGPLDSENSNVGDSTPAVNSNDDSGSIWGDPHYVGADGDKFDFMGKPGGTYNVLSDKNFQYNAHYVPWGNDDATVTGAVGFQFANKDGSVDQVAWERQKWVDGSAQQVAEPPRLNGQVMETGKVYALEGGQILWNGEDLKVTSYSRDTNDNVIQDADGPRKEYEVKIISNDNYFDQEIKVGDTWSDGVDPDGLWGQTVDADTTARVGNGKQGKGAIDIIENGQRRLSTEADTDETIINQYQVGNTYSIEDLFSTTIADERGQAFVKFNA